MEMCLMSHQTEPYLGLILGSRPEMDQETRQTIHRWMPWTSMRWAVAHPVFAINSEGEAEDMAGFLKLTESEVD